MTAISPSLPAALSKARDKLYSVNFSSVYISSERSNGLIIDGARVEVKFASSSADGRWHINIHRHGAVDESGVDAYLFVLRGVPGNTRMPLYLVFRAPLERATMAFSFSSLLHVYQENCDGWDILREVIKRRQKAVRVGK